MEEWSVVRRRQKRGSAASHSPAAAATGPEVGTLSSDSSITGKKPGRARDLEERMVTLAISGEAEGGPEAEDEERLLAEMQRAIDKVKQSQFFLTFMKQVRELEVMEGLTGRAEEAGGGAVDSASEEGFSFEKEVGGEESVLATAASTVVQLVVYGVGSIANSEVSRYQLALAVLLKRRIAAFGNVYVFDPIMVLSECRVMLRLGCVPLKDNDEGRVRLNGPTLMYMPHCDAELYESVLRANLKPGGIKEMVILGNSFRTYQERWSMSPLPPGERPACLLGVQPSVEEVPVVDQFEFSSNAFNDTSWHFFSKAGVS